MEAQALVEAWLSNGRARVAADGGVVFEAKAGLPLADKLRQAYRWIAQNAVYSPYEDLEFSTGSTLVQGEARVELPGGEGYASFLLLPLLTLITSRRLLFIGAPGRGKTTVATLMALLTGEGLQEARRSIQHGHPQLTIADLLGAPLPSELIRAERGAGVAVEWRGWIGKRVKIIDEYNRIPTKTQSALLSLMAEGYAEMYEQVIEAGRSAWFLTANDELGGGTFPVIEALKDRIDVVVRCTPFHGRYLDALVERIEASRTPEEFVPSQLIFSAQELDEIDAQVRAVPVPADVREVLGFALGQLDFCRRASDRLEAMNKDTLHVAGRKVGHVCTEDCPLDKQEHLCTQTESGVSARAYQTLIHYAKAMAYVRGQEEVSVQDVRQLLPWVLHEKVLPNVHSPFFQKAEHQVYLVDKAAWLRQLFDRALAQRAAYAPLREPVRELQAQLSSRLEGLSSAELRQGAAAARRQMEELLRRSELSGPVHEDLLLLRSLFGRCQAELARRAAGRSV